MVVVSYFRNDEYNLVNAFKEVCNQHSSLDCIFSKTLQQVPINTLKNTGIQAVKTSHFFVIDCNLVPTSIFSRIVWWHSELVQGLEENTGLFVERSQFCRRYPRIWMVF